MSTLTVADVIRKTGVLVRCPRCKGSGREGRGLMSRPCGCCGGRGKLLTVEDQATYLATQGQDALDVGGPLEEFVNSLLPTCDLIDGDVIVWLLQPDHGPRAVALLAKGADGNTAPRWL